MQQTYLPPSELPPPVWVADPAGLAVLTHALSQEPSFAIDTESNSLYAYRERVCLIQFSTPACDFVLDPLCFSDLDALGPLMADPRKQKIFHASEYDLLCLKRDFHFEFAEIFDTMVAARILGWPKAGLASVLEARFGVKLDKRHQRSDWGKRPLPPEQLEYARLDTHYLIGLRDLQLGELRALGGEEEAFEEFARLARAQTEEFGFDPHGFWRISGATELPPPQLSVLRELYLFREQQAERSDRPPFKIVGERTLVEIAQLCPTRVQALKRIHGMTDGQIRRYGYALIKAVQRGLKAPHPRRPRPERVPGHIRERYERLQQWRKEKARERGVESDVILPREALWEIARLGPQALSDMDQLDQVGPWRRKKYGAELIQLLNSHDK